MTLLSRAKRRLLHLYHSLYGRTQQSRASSRPFGCKTADLEHPWRLPFPKLATETDVLYCFRLILGRLPGKPEWRGHRGLAGGDLTEVVRTYLSSKEFSERQLMQPQTVEGWELVQLGGYTMYVPPLDSEVGRHIYGAQCYEPNVTAAIQRQLAPGLTFIDVGANIGYYTLMAAHRVGETGTVVAFEPNPSNVRFIHASALANRFGHLRVYPFAVADSEVLLGYSSMGTNGVISWLTTERDVLTAPSVVHAVRLDDVLQGLEAIDIIKIDVEGAEHSALVGAGAIIESHHPVIFSEFAPYALEAVSGVSGDDYLRLLIDDYRYRISVIDPDGQLVDYDRNIDGVMRAFEQADSDHIDIVAMP